MKLVLSSIMVLRSVGVYSQDSSLDLHGLYEPAPVQFNFETPGWYLLGGIIVFTAIIVTIMSVRKYVKNRYRREALRELDQLTNAPELFPQLYVILKKTAIYAFGREQVGHLYGKEWLSFLENTGRGVNLANYQEQISRYLYTSEGIEPGEQKIILLNARNWVRTHAV